MTASASWIIWKFREAATSFIKFPIPCTTRSTEDRTYIRRTCGHLNPHPSTRPDWMNSTDRSNQTKTTMAVSFSCPFSIHDLRFQRGTICYFLTLDSSKITLWSHNSSLRISLAWSTGRHIGDHARSRAYSSSSFTNMKSKKISKTLSHGNLSGSITQWKSSTSLPLDPLNLSVLLVRKGLHINKLQQMNGVLGSKWPPPTVRKVVNQQQQNDAAPQRNVDMSHTDRAPWFLGVVLPLLFSKKLRKVSLDHLEYGT